MHLYAVESGIRTPRTATRRRRQNTNDRDLFIITESAEAAVRLWREACWIEDDTICPDAVWEIKVPVAGPERVLQWRYDVADVTP